MELTFLGTGTSQGVPMIAFDAHACDLEDKRNWRTRTSVHVVMGGRHIQVDAGPEFRLQCLWNRVTVIDFFILTHGHSDHLMGMDDLRRFCDLRGGGALPVYSTLEGLRRIAEVYPYAIGDKPVAKGYPAFQLNEMPAVMQLEEGTIRSCLLPHGSMLVLGLVFEERASGRRLAYYTDCKAVEGAAREMIREVDVLVIDGLRPKPHPTHLSIDEAADVARETGARRTYLTHLTHLVDHAACSKKLPPGVQLAHDGLRIEI